jgi:hypothetical protein
MKEFMEVIREGEALDPSFRQRAAAIPQFEENYTAFIELIANVPGYTSNYRRYLMKEAESTTDFPILFGTVLERQLREKYKLQDPDWKKYIKTRTVNDFRTSWDMALYGNRGTLPVVKERGEYKDAALNDGKFTLALQKYGRGFSLSWESLINDDLGAFSDISNDLVLSARNTEAFVATSTFAGASGPNSTLFQIGGTHPIDGKSFTNKVNAGASGTFNATNLATALTAMKSQKDYDGNPILFERFILVTPVALEFAAMQVLSQNLLIATALTSSSAATGGNNVVGTTSENILAKYPITQVTNPWLDIIDTTAGTKTWYLFGEPTSGDAVVLGYLRGHETPEICQKMSDKITLGGGPISPMEGDFDSDSSRWRVRHVLGSTVTDPRFAYASIGQ